ncbi:uncharacterized protein LOC125501767 [Athalia rosae]|uniref:uncharacterized protein LOC125501767 n=1 Tax=Athalia rosae TaxID=37344 RepID=UPI002033910B|nr:uncharacterized protein LOC125501767 [Athalia rosae]
MQNNYRGMRSAVSRPDDVIFLPPRTRLASIVSQHEHRQQKREKQKRKEERNETVVCAPGAAAAAAAAAASEDTYVHACLLCIRIYTRRDTHTVSILRKGDDKVCDAGAPAGSEYSSPLCFCFCCPQVPVGKECNGSFENSRPPPSPYNAILRCPKD